MHWLYKRPFWLTRPPCEMTQQEREAFTESRMAWLRLLPRLGCLLDVYYWIGGLVLGLVPSFFMVLAFLHFFQWVEPLGSAALLAVVLSPFFSACVLIPAWTITLGIWRAWQIFLTALYQSLFDAYEEEYGD